MLFHDQRRLVILLVFLCGVGLFSAGCSCGPAASPGWSAPAVSDGILYVGTMDGPLVALDVNIETDNGARQLWVEDLESASSQMGLFACGSTSTVASPLNTYAAPAFGNDKVYVGTFSGKLYAFDSQTGSTKWTFDTGDAIVGGIAVDGETVYVGSSNGKFFALQDQGSRVEKKWEFATDNMIWSTPVVDDGTVYVASADSRLYALIDRGDSFEQKWDSFEAEAGFLSTPLIYEDTIYIGSCDRRFYAIDAGSGDLKDGWSSPQVERWFWTTALVVDGNVYAGNLDHKLYVFDAASGSPVWEYETGGRITAPPILLNGVIVVGSEDGNLYLFDAVTGESVATCALEAPILAPLFVDEGVVYVHAQNGSHIVYALEIQQDGTVVELWQFNTGEA